MIKIFPAVFILVFALPALAQSGRGMQPGGGARHDHYSGRSDASSFQRQPDTQYSRRDSDGGRQAASAGPASQVNAPLSYSSPARGGGKHPGGNQQRYIKTQPSVVYGAPSRVQRSSSIFNPAPNRIVTKTYYGTGPSVMWWPGATSVYYGAPYYYGSSYYYSSSYYTQAQTGADSAGQNNSVFGGYENWGFARVNAGAAQAAGIDGSGVGIMLIDSGAASHDEFGPDSVQMLDFTGSGPYDLDGHGTRVAGVIVARGSKVAGVAPGATVYSAKVSKGSMLSAQIASAINWAIEQNKTAPGKISVIDLSYGFPSPQPDLADAIRRAYAAGITVVAPAGNEGKVMFPAIMQEVIAVAASTPQEQAYANTSYGRSVSFIAPGSMIYTTGLNNGYVWADGACMAAASISGLAALAVQNYRQTSGGANPSPARVRQMLSNISTLLPGLDPSFQGYGMPDAGRLVQ